MLVVSYNLTLLAATVLLAIMSGFTGLSLTNGVSRLPASKRKPAIVRAATVLGGGVWSTHFVAMLALELPIEVFYDPVYTLASALMAILMTGAALLLLHFRTRTPTLIGTAGLIMGLGVVAMHYIGMYGMRGCAPVFYVSGYLASTVLAIVICIGAMQVAYRKRSLRGLIAGGVIYGLAILVMHFTAMSQTGFLPLEDLEASVRLVRNDVLALLVVFTAFLICGAFLLTSVTLRDPAKAVLTEGTSIEAGRGIEHTSASGASDAPDTSAKHDDVPPVAAATLHASSNDRLPFEQDGKTFFAPLSDIVAIQAEGHYTRLHRISGEAFCPLPISKLTDDLSGREFLRTHRSYLVNMNYVQGFERRKDQAVCLFAPELGIEPAPVSRANVAATKEALGLA